MSKKLVLTMIVKNEAAVIERCLASTLPAIDTWCIVDTGSTDGTQEKIKQFFENVGIEGQLHERPWVSFDVNRSQALELARPLGDYSLMIDADEILEFDNDFNPETFKEGLKADLYNVFSFYGGIKYHRPQLTSNAKEFYYRGVLHEYVDCKEEIKTRDFCRGFINKPVQDGARSKDPAKYAKDAETFERALQGDVDPREFNRYHFYLAQSYRDSQQWDKAIEAYQKRADLGGWNEEVYYSLYQIGAIKEILKKPIDEIITHYLHASQVNPWRVEPYWAIARVCRHCGRFDQAYIFAKKGLAMKYPEGALFLTAPVYEWCIQDEFAIASYWTGKFAESAKVSKKMLQDNKFPANQKQRIEANYQFAMEAILES